MAAENENVDNQEQESQEEGGVQQGFLQSNLVKTIIRFLGWGVAIFAGIGIMILTMLIVLELRGDAPEDKSIVDPKVIESPPIYGVFPLDQFTINLDKAEAGDKTTLVTAELVLAYPRNRKDIESELNNRKEQLTDAIQSIIARKKWEEINSADKRENNLKLELINELNRNLINKGIVDIFITQFEIARF